MKTALAVLASALFALTGCSGSGSDDSADDAPKVSAFEKAKADCLDVVDVMLEDPALKADADRQMVISVDGKSVSVERGDGHDEVSVVAGNCLLDQLGAPSSTWDQVSSTTALMGRQKDSWEGYEATWSYHPDNGLYLLIEEAK